MSDEFRSGSGLIMMSSDVSARGVDYPDVSLVVQVWIGHVHGVAHDGLLVDKVIVTLLLTTIITLPFMNAIVLV